MSLLALAVTDRVTGNKDHDSFCRDLTDYGDLTYINETINVCTSELKKTCVDKTEEMCMDVTHMDCDVELFTDCAMDWTTHDVVESKPTTLTKHLPTCIKKTKPEEHEKVHYECKNVTKQHCTSLWKVVNGEKVWAGNDDCKDVTWEECEPIPVKVEWEVPYMECITTPHSYLSYENVTRPVMADTMECRVEKRVVCKPRKENKCASITYTTCSEVRETLLVSLVLTSCSGSQGRLQAQGGALPLQGEDTQAVVPVRPGQRYHGWNHRDISNRKSTKIQKIKQRKYLVSSAKVRGKL